MRARRMGNRLLAEVADLRDGPRRGEGQEKEQGREAPRSRRIRKVPRSLVVNLAESPLGWLLARGLVDERQFAAGEQLRSDWERAQLSPRVTAVLDGPPLSRNARGAPEILDPTEAQIAAKRRFEAAIERVGPSLSDIAWRIVCAGEGMRDAEQALGWPARAGRLVLTIALDRLADFYRIR